MSVVLKTFASTTGHWRGAVHFSRSERMKRTPVILFAAAFSFATRTAVASKSLASTFRAPKMRAANARIPLPVPRSSASHSVPRSSCATSAIMRRHDAVVACSPVPNATVAGMSSAGVFACCFLASASSFSVETTSSLPRTRNGGRGFGSSSLRVRGRATRSVPPNALTSVSASVRVT